MREDREGEERSGETRLNNYQRIIKHRITTIQSKGINLEILLP